MKHLNLVSQLPRYADEFTTGQKLTLAAGITDAISNFYTVKEAPEDTTTETT